MHIFKEKLNELRELDVWEMKFSLDVSELVTDPERSKVPSWTRATHYLLK